MTNVLFTLSFTWEMLLLLAGTGALIVALLSCRLVIWTTVLKHQTVSFLKEGHMTDCISKAVEQPGAEKTMKAVAREPSSDHWQH